MMDMNFYQGKRVLITGHTGFKGTWLSKMLEMAGAEVTGYALPSPTKEGADVFVLSGAEAGMQSVIGDVRDYDSLLRVFKNAKPEIVFHLAAQPIVLESYRDPIGTYSANVMGTVHVLECIRQMDTVRSFVNVTTDKVYQNNEWAWGYREIEPLDGFDPYSNSKSCSELVTHSYQRSFFADRRVAISTARAGNVIGGGDFAENRIIPDCIRAASKKVPIEVRNPYSTRPYQFVLDPLYAYCLIAKAQYEDHRVADSYNVGPDEHDCVSTGDLVQMFCASWGQGVKWINKAKLGAPHEARFLKLDCSKLKSTLGWKPRYGIKEAVEKTVDWNKCWLSGGKICACMDAQIIEFMEEK